jgi:hypothetical protein
VNEQTREWVLAGIVGALVLGGLALDLGPAPERPGVPAPQASGFVDRASFCPPTIAVPGYRETLVYSGGEGNPAVGLEPLHPRPAPLAAGRISLVAPEERTGQAVVGYGEPAFAGAAMRSTESKRAGAGGGSCTSETSSSWYFPAGTSAIGYDQRILLHNPFPDEAVVRVSLLTPAGEPLDQAGLDDVAVPPGEYQEIVINEFVTPREHIGAAVIALRGRVVAWKAIIGAARESPHGFELTVGAPGPAVRWFFPHGLLGEGTEETIALLNPNDRQVTATVSLAGERNAVQPAGLVDFPVPPHSSRKLSLGAVAPNSLSGSRRGASVTVTSTNGLPLVAERRLASAGENDSGRASELGSSVEAREWWLSPPVLGASEDLVALLNPSARDARVSLELLFSDRPPLRPEALRRIRIGAGLRAAVSLDRWRSAGIAAVLVSSDAPLVAERVSYSAAARDMADVMGTPLTPSAR